MPNTVRTRAVLLLGVSVLAACSAGGSGANDGGETDSSADVPAAPDARDVVMAPDTRAGDSGAASDVTARDAATPSDASGDTGTPPACDVPLPEYRNGNGSVTYYTFSQGSAQVHCGFEVLGQNPDVVAHVATGNGQFFGAMNTTDYNNAAACGACVEVTRDGTRSVVITIVDECPSAGNPVCTAGHIDLSEQAFLQLGAASEGYLGTGNGGAAGVISWRYVACPTTENVSYRLKEPTNQYWNQILVQSHRFPITSVEANVNGAWQAGVRQSYNYWQVGSGNLGTAPYQVRVTDVFGAQVTATLDLADGDQVSSSQFPSCP